MQLQALFLACGLLFCGTAYGQIRIQMKGVRGINRAIQFAPPQGVRGINGVIQFAPPQVVRPTSSGRQTEFVADRDSYVRLKRAKQLLADGKHEPALKLLQSLLDAPQDWLMPPEQGKPADSRSVKDETEAVLAGLSKEARRAYELEYGADAGIQRKDAVKRQDWEQLNEVAARYFMTAAGQDAEFHLGVNALHRGNPLAAIRRFERLRKLKQPGEMESQLSLLSAVAWAKLQHEEESRKALERFRRSAGDRITLGGREVPLFAATDDPLNWLGKTLGTKPVGNSPPLRQWLTFRGDETNTAVSSSASPIWQTAWERATVLDDDDPHIPADRLKRADQAFERLAFSHLEHRDSLSMPVAHPLLVGDLVVYRTLKNVRAADARTGEIRWESDEFDFDFVKLVGGTIAGGNNSRFDELLNRRLWNDLTFGTLSSDGKRVFMLDDLRLPDMSQPSVRGLGRLPVSNMLKAIDIATGNLLWEVGASLDYGLPLAGTFFLGPPTRLGEHIAVLGETDGEIRLIVLDPIIGKVLWQQPLAVPSLTVAQHPFRQLAGLTPAHSAGIVVCPTTSGTVVAVDHTRKRLLWTFRYVEKASRFTEQLRVNPFGNIERVPQPGVDDNKSRWWDSVPTIAGSRVLLTPRDSDELICLNLHTGEVEWRQPRGEGLYVAGLHDQTVVIVQRSAVWAYRLADGGDAWSQPLKTAAPSGRGFQTAGLYHLPLETGHIATIDLDTGRLLAQSATPNNRVPGNLVSAGGRVVCQTLNSLVAFTPLDELQGELNQHLAKNQNDADALAARGELRLHRGNEAAGLADLRASLKQQPTPRARQALVSALMGGLRFDFAKYQSTTEEIKKWIDDPRQKEAFFRMRADGLSKTGKFTQAFEEYVHLAAVDHKNLKMEYVDGSRKVRGDRWLRPRLQDLSRRAKAGDRARLDAAIHAQLTAILKEKSPAALKQFLYGIPHHPASEQARQALVELLDDEHQSLELEWHLLELRKSKDEEIAGKATARLADLLLRLNNRHDARPLVDELADRFAKLNCLNGETGAELARKWREEKTHAAILNSRRTWPKTEFLVQTKATIVDSIVHPMTLIVHQHTGPFFRGWRFSTDREQQRLLAEDAEGRLRWSAVLSSQPIPFTSPGRVLIHGHVIAVSLGSQFAVLNAQSGVAAKKLWGKRWSQVNQLGFGRQVFINGQVINGGGGVAPGTGEIASLSPHCICYQTDQLLVGADPLTGDAVWHQPRDGQVLRLSGNEDYLIGELAGRKRAYVYRTAEGSQINNIALPDHEVRLMEEGEKWLLWKPDRTVPEIRLADVLTGNTIWRKNLKTKSPLIAANVQMIGRDEVAILDAAGRLIILSAKDGTPRLDTLLPQVVEVKKYEIRRTPDHYVVMTNMTGKVFMNRPNMQFGGLQGFPMGGAVNESVVDGPAFGIDRKTGKIVWQVKLENRFIAPPHAGNLPILLLAQRQRGGLRNRFGNAFDSVEVLDTRTGKVIHHQKSVRQTADIAADDERSAIHVRFGNSEALLKPTEKPLKKELR